MIISGVADSQDKTKNCVVIKWPLKQIDGGTVDAYLFHIDGNLVDHTVSGMLAQAWFEHKSCAVKNPVKVRGVEVLKTGQILILHTD